MIYNNAVDQLKGLKPEDDVPFRLAKVTSLSSGRAYVQFYGESTASGKLYPYIEGYKPEVNDDVLLLKQGSTYIILGKVSKSDIVNNYNLTKAVADNLYQAKGSTSTTDRLTSNSKEIILTGVTLDPSENGTFYLGSASKKYKVMYVTRWEYNQTHVLYWDDANHLVSYVPSGEKLWLGTNSKPVCVTAGQLDLVGSVYPQTTKTYNLGSSSLQFNNAYAKQFYQNGTAISTSDRRKKTNIRDIAKKYLDFFKRLKPRSFRFKDGESGRTHTGFIAQEVEEAAAESKISNKDLAFLCIDENGDYGLRYEELIAIQTQVIQNLMERVERLENIVKERDTEHV